VDLEFTAEEKAFRDEVRSFIRENLPEETRKRIEDGRGTTKQDMVDWMKILADKGWSAPRWPEEYGGPGWDPIRQYIFMEEIQSNNAPDPQGFNISMVGPVIYTFGNEEQKKKFLEPTRDCSIWWCQGFSEPGAGSDLASLKTKAVRDGDHYIVNGQKTWTTLAQHADWIFCLVRTDPDAPKKQMGISFLLIDMNTPGITVRPIQTIDGGVEVNEVFFDDVKVPAENLVGEENKGWDYAKFLLGNERIGIARVGVSKAKLRRIKELANSVQDGGRSLMENPRFAEKVRTTEVELKALEMTQLRVLSDIAIRGGKKPHPASSVLKLKGSEIQQTITSLMMDVVGPYALPKPDRSEGSNEPPVGPDWADAVAPSYFNTRKVTIYGGSSEVQKGIIAKAILGL
jgi:pimeloyl-CoA dehydrogenase large subunit